MTLIFVGSARSLRAAARTAVFVSKVLPMVPSRPIDWVTTAPVVERVRYLTPLGEADGDLYRPAGAGPHPGVVVCLGVVPFGVDHPQVPRLGAALARAGFAALLYWSPAMHDQRLDPQDVEGIAMAYRWLIERPTVDASRSGLLGTCVGGSFALMAAADPCIRDRVAFVVAQLGRRGARGRESASRYRPRTIAVESMIREEATDVRPHPRPARRIGVGRGGAGGH